MSKRGRFSKWIAIIALVGFGLGLLGLLSGSASGPGKGEVGAILYGAFMMLLFFFSAIALFVAGWSWFASTLIV